MPTQRESCLLPNPDDLPGRQLRFLAIVAGAGAVDDEEIAAVENEQKVVPRALVVVDALIALGAEQPDLARVETAAGSDRDEIGAAAERDKGLAPQRVALEDP